MPFDADDGRPINQGIQDLALFQVRRNKDVSLQTGRSGVRRHRIGQVASRSASHRIETQLLGAAQSHTHDAVLERQTRIINGIILDPKLPNAEPPGKSICLY